MPSSHNRRTDYTRQLRPRPSAYQPSAPRPVRPSVVEAEQTTISIRVSYPDFSRWRLYKFARQYPYLALAVSVGILMVLVLLVDGALWLWHIVNKTGARS